MSARISDILLSGIASADHAIWVNLFSANTILKYDPATGAIQEFSMTPSAPPSSSSPAAFLSTSGSQTAVAAPLGVDFVAAVASLTTATSVPPSTFTAVTKPGDGKASAGHLLLGITDAHGAYGNHTYLSVGTLKITATISETQAVDGTPKMVENSRALSV